ncbi:unnamed protein product [Pieris macdunnoughi]|uniref:Endonuclease/exonuclease/phosphatase domain-containing protein n=1 Tax=Pieris macdunnoughi TaxID=345717 RepID=A0A821W9Z8_9NEOP|nr:unnamed protein product [Pieris macdunnoughi]
MCWPGGQYNTAKVLPNEIKVMQANVQRSAVATEELIFEAKKQRISILLVQEPYIGAARSMKNYSGTRVYQHTGSGNHIKAAIVVLDNNIHIIQHPEISSPNMIAISVDTQKGKLSLVSIYFEPYPIPLSPYLQTLKQAIEKLGPRTIVGGDINARNVWWGDRITNERGEEAEATFHSAGLEILNQGGTPTFNTNRGNTLYTSCVDVTVATPDLLGLIVDWRVDQSVTSSDHNAIQFEITSRIKRDDGHARSTRVYNVRKANWTHFRAKFKQLLSEHELTSHNINTLNSTTLLENTIVQYTQLITDTCDTHIPKIKVHRKHTTPLVDRRASSNEEKRPKNEEENQILLCYPPTYCYRAIQQGEAGIPGSSKQE